MPARRRQIDYYTSEFDFPRSIDPPQVRYAVATTPRSGSTYFCSQLWRTGALGAPLEYLNHHMTHAGRPPPTEEEACRYWSDAMRRRTSPNGVFGTKLFIGDFRRIIDEAPSLLAEIRFTHVIHLVRRDRADQAVSYWRAMKTRRWFKENEAAPPLVYDRAGIGKADEMVAGQAEAWRNLFDLMGVTPLEVAYEDFCAEERAVMQRIAGHFGVHLGKLPAIAVSPPEVQRDEQSARFRARYLEDERKKAFASLGRPHLGLGQ